jgi:hypothetical protein
MLSPHQTRLHAHGDGMLAPDDVTKMPQLFRCVTEPRPEEAAPRRCFYRTTAFPVTARRVGAGHARPFANLPHYHFFRRLILELVLNAHGDGVLAWRTVRQRQFVIQLAGI